MTIVIPKSAVVKPPDMRADSGVVLSEEEESRLIRAIESAIEVRRTDQFHSWMRGPFRAVLPHESVVCMELGGRGDARQVAFLHHTLMDTATTDLLCHPKLGLAARLTELYPGRTQLCRTVEAHALDGLLGREFCAAGQLRNAVFHRTNFLSGAAYFIVLVNVAEDRIERCQQVFKLLSSHLKMALSRAIAANEHRGATALTAREMEILRWMAAGSSNREISAVLGISAITLKNHIAKIYRKLDVQNRADAIAQALRLSAAEASR